MISATQLDTRKPRSRPAGPSPSGLARGSFVLKECPSTRDELLAGWTRINGKVT
jgi:hypothetical protein